MYLAPANVHEGEVVWEVTAGTSGLLLGDRNYWLPTIFVALLFHRFLVSNAENGRAKNWRGHIFSRLTWSDGNDTLPLWHSSIFAPFWRIPPTRLDPTVKISAQKSQARL